MDQIVKAVVRSSFALALATLFALPAMAGVTVYEDGDKSVTIGGRIQLQYHATDPDGGDSEDEVFFRRLRPYIEGTVTENWSGKFQFDVGNASDGNEVSVKDAFFYYTGFEDLKITIGNTKPPFSREFQISSKEQQLVERTFVGDHNYGAPDYMAGVRLDGQAGERLTWAGSFGSSSVDPDASKMDFDTPINRNADFNEGWLGAGRVEFHPFGIVDEAQGDLSRSGSLGLTLGAAAFNWSNDGDNDTYTEGGVSTSSSRADLDSATGFELAVGVRGFGFSGDAQYQVVDGETVDPGFSGGVFVNGDTELEQLALEGGYMLVPDRLEAVVGYENQDADGYADAWTRTSVGLNYFLNAHKLKGQLTYRMGENLDGVPGNDSDEVFLQLQYVF